MCADILLWSEKKKKIYHKRVARNKLLQVHVVGQVAYSVQRLATGWMVRGSNAGVGDIFRTCPDRPWGPPSLLYNRYRIFPGSKERPGRDADPSPISSAVVMKAQSCTSTHPLGRTACTEPHCLYKGALCLFYLQYGLSTTTKFYLNVTPFRLVHKYRRFEGLQCRLLQDQLAQNGTIYQSTQRNISGDFNSDRKPL